MSFNFSLGFTPFENTNDTSLSYSPFINDNNINQNNIVQNEQNEKKCKRYMKI